MPALFVILIGKAETFKAAEEGLARVKTARILLRYGSGAMGERWFGGR